MCIFFVFQDKLKQFQERLAEERRNRLEERKKQRKEERRITYYREKEEEEQRLREEQLLKGITENVIAARMKIFCIWVHNHAIFKKIINKSLVSYLQALLADLVFVLL